MNYQNVWEFILLKSKMLLFLLQFWWESPPPGLSVLQMLACYQVFNNCCFSPPGPGWALLSRHFVLYFKVLEESQRLGCFGEPNVQNHEWSHYIWTTISGISTENTQETNNKLVAYGKTRVLIYGMGDKLFDIYSFYHFLKFEPCNCIIYFLN